MRFRLRYLHHDLELTEGQFVVGRSAGCQLSLDDPLVSRRHALLVVSHEAVSVEDLGSRNGVVVNGERIAGRRPLAPGDKLMIGSQELMLLEGRDSAGRETASLQMGKRTLPRFPAAPELMAAGEHGVVDHGITENPPSAPTGLPLPPGFASPTGMPPPGVVGPPGPPGLSAPRTPSEPDSDSSMVRRVDAFNLLGSVAEKALAMGRADEAERLLASPLADVVEASRSGKRLSPWLVDMAARFAAKLATSTAKGAWADYVIELYDAQVRPCPGPVVDELYNAFRKVNAVDLVRLRAYVGRLREKLPSFGPAERFLIQRIEGLERLAALR